MHVSFIAKHFFGLETSRFAHAAVAAKPCRVCVCAADAGSLHTCRVAFAPTMIVCHAYCDHINTFVFGDRGDRTVVLAAE